MYLILAPAPNVPAEGELLLGELVLAQQIVELVHGQVDDVGAGDGQTHGLSLPLVPAHSRLITIPSNNTIKPSDPCQYVVKLGIHIRWILRKNTF